MQPTNVTISYKQWKQIEMLLDIIYKGVKNYVAVRQSTGDKKQDKSNIKNAKIQLADKVIEFTSSPNSMGLFD